MATPNDDLDNNPMGLTDEELAAINGEDDNSALEELANEADSDSDEADDAGEDETDNDGEDTGDEEEGEQQETRDFVPTYHVDPVENFDEQIQGFVDEKKALREQLNAGEIDLDAYEEQKDSIIAKEQDLRAQNLKAQIASEQTTQTAQAKWEWEQENFFNNTANKIYQDKLLGAMLDTAVKDLAGAPENANKTGAWFLQEADRMVRERIGSKETTKTTSRKPDLSKVPPSLGGLPSAELTDTGNDKFAKLDTLSGLALERALAGLSDRERDDYLGVNA